MKCRNCGYNNPQHEKICINCHELLDVVNDNRSMFPNKNFINFIPIIGFVISIILLFAFGVIQIPGLFLDQKHTKNISEHLTTIKPQVTEQKKIQETETEPEPSSSRESVPKPQATQQIIYKEPESEPANNLERTPYGKIVFTCQVDRQMNHDQICIINADGTGFKQLTNNLNHQHYYASLSPDGQTIVFSGSNGVGVFEIFEMDLDGNKKQLTFMKEQLFAPEISPDGSRIVFTRHINPERQYISIMNRDGTHVRNLTDLRDSRDPIWSPDGTQILFTSNASGSYQIYIMNSDGSDPKRITNIAGLRGRTDWHNDGTIITYAGEAKLQNREIISLKNGETPIFITNMGDNLAPSFSPDGQWIAFMSYRAEKWYADGCEIYIMRRDGSDIRRLTNNNYCDYQPRWGN